MVLHYYDTFFPRIVNGFLIVGFMIITIMYAVTLISFFSVDVYPEPPDTFEKVIKEVIDKDLEVIVCCYEIENAMRDSSLDSIQTLLAMVGPIRDRQSFQFPIQSTSVNRNSSLIGKFLENRI